MNNHEFIKDMWDRAIHQEAIELCIKQGLNFYFLEPEEQKNFLEKAQKSIRQFLASQGMV